MKLLDFIDIADTPTRRVPAILSNEQITARLYGQDAHEARCDMLPAETPDQFFLRLWLFYRHNTRMDTARMEAIEGIQP